MLFAVSSVYVPCAEPNLPTVIVELAFDTETVSVVRLTVYPESAELSCDWMSVAMISPAVVPVRSSLPVQVYVAVPLSVPSMIEMRHTVPMAGVAEGTSWIPTAAVPEPVTTISVSAATVAPCRLKAVVSVRVTTTRPPSCASV
jgi:hypothetical protein